MIHWLASGCAMRMESTRTRICFFHDNDYQRFKLGCACWVSNVQPLIKKYALLSQQKSWNTTLNKVLWPCYAQYIEHSPRNPPPHTHTSYLQLLVPVAKTCPWSNHELGVNNRSTLNSTSAVTENTSLVLPNLVIKSISHNRNSTARPTSLRQRKTWLTHHLLLLAGIPIEWFLVFFCHSSRRIRISDWLISLPHYYYNYPQFRFLWITLLPLLFAYTIR